MGKEHKRSRRDEKDSGSKEREHHRVSDTSKEKELHKESDKDRRVSSRDRRVETEDYKKDRYRDKVRDKDYDKKVREKDYDQRDRYKERERDNDHKDRGKDKDREREREASKEHHDRGRERKDKERDRVKDREREKHKDREREKEKDKDRDRTERERGKGKDREREKEREREMDGDTKEMSKDMEKDKLIGKNRDGGDDKAKYDGRSDKGVSDHGHGSSNMEHKPLTDVASGGTQQSTSEIEQRIIKMREERLKEKSEGVSEVLSWVSKSRKLEEKINAEKVKALHLSKVFEEQDNNVLGESEDEEPATHTIKDLAGVKILHGLDKVIEGGAVVLTLKDQNILADGDINDEVDMLENVEIGEQKHRDDAYKAAKKKTGTYVDKFNDEFGAEKKMLPQYDDPVENEAHHQSQTHDTSRAES